ncbi:hypothetical protein GP486_005363, partial [Trichoglossum hirsutum]
MLNPRCFLEDCLRHGKIDFWATGIPWAVIAPLIDGSSFTYGPPSQAVSLFESQTRLAWDNLNDPSKKEIVCPICRTRVDVPWTTCTDGKVTSDVGSYFAAGTGYAESDFRFPCPGCGLTLRHELLRVQKFKKDVQQLLINNRPMPGTVLSVTGKAERCKKSSILLHDVFFPNYVIKLVAKHSILALADTRGKAETVTVDDVKRILEDAIATKANLQKINSRLSYTISKESKIAMRRMMSCYWSNSSVFYLDLVGAVIRQGSFIEKMHSIDWYHSPTVSATMARLIQKYYRFFTIMKENPGKTAVPTLDVDLAWHTQQLSPSVYYAYSVEKTEIFIDHDDKIEENKLSDAFEWTSKTYQRMYNQAYSECTCWYCESIRASHDSGLSRLHPSVRTVERSADRAGYPSDVHSSPHISSHNAVRNEDTDPDKQAAALEIAYMKACKRARKKGWKEPERGEYSYLYYSNYG